MIFLDETYMKLYTVLELISDRRLSVDLPEKEIHDQQFPHIGNVTL